MADEKGFDPYDILRAAGICVGARYDCQNEKAILELVPYLHSESPEVRKRTAEALYAIGYWALQKDDSDGFDGAYIRLCVLAVDLSIPSDAREVLLSRLEEDFRSSLMRQACDEYVCHIEFVDSFLKMPFVAQRKKEEYLELRAIRFASWGYGRLGFSEPPIVCAFTETLNCTEISEEVRIKIAARVFRRIPDWIAERRRKSTFDRSLPRDVYEDFLRYIISADNYLCDEKKGTRMDSATLPVAIREMAAKCLEKILAKQGKKDKPTNPLASYGVASRPDPKFIRGPEPVPKPTSEKLTRK